MAQNMIAQLAMLADKCARRFALALIGGYQLFLSPFFGDGCRFSPTCSEYAREVFRTRNAYSALFLTLRRLFRCHPFCEGGEDPPPPPKNAMRD